MFPFHPIDRHLLGIGATYIDGVLPFGLCSAPKIFNSIADLLQWIIIDSTCTTSVPVHVQVTHRHQCTNIQTLIYKHISGPLSPSPIPLTLVELLVSLRPDWTDNSCKLERQNVTNTHIIIYKCIYCIIIIINNYNIIKYSLQLISCQ